MDEWLAIVLAGALGGGMSTLVPAGTEFPWARALQPLFEQHVLIGLLGHLLRNTLLGALASFVVWGLANPGLDFASNAVTVGEVASGIIVGGGGVGALNNLFQQSARLESKDKAIEMAETLLEAETEENGGEG